MTREVIKRCDICRKETNRIAGKLFFTATAFGSGVKITDSNNYSYHLDIGECCKDKIHKAFNWHGRKTMREYQDSRKKKQVMTEART